MDSNRAADLLNRIQTANHYITMAVFFVLDFVCFVCLLLFLLFGFCLLIDGGILFCFILPLFLMFCLLVVVSTTTKYVYVQSLLRNKRMCRTNAQRTTNEQ